MSTESFFLYKNCKNTSSKSKQYQRNASIIKKFENARPEKQGNSIPISCIVEDETKTISKLRKYEHQTRNRFQTKLCVENHFFVQNLQENYAVLWTLIKATRRMAKNTKL